MATTLPISANLHTLLVRSESCSLKAYYDVSGYAIGYGHHGVGIVWGDVWTQTQADNQLLLDAQSAQSQVKEACTRELTQGELDALTDFVYNLGIRSLLESHLLKYINDGDFSRVPIEFRRWVLIAGKPSIALAVRREAEISLFIEQTLADEETCLTLAKQNPIFQAERGEQIA